MDLLEQLGQLTTEAVNPRTVGMDLLPTRQVVALLHQEDQLVDNAVSFALDGVAAAADLLAETLRAGKRMAYVGAGTSGRLGILDASEMPPTFGLDGDLISGIIAGGAAAVFRSIEGAEDDPLKGAQAISDSAAAEGRQLGMVIGLSASGRTPFVLGALEQAAHMGMHTVLVSTNDAVVVHAFAPYVKTLICVPVGPEAIAGSTRMKSGTAQKMVVNMISTAAMVRLGKTYGNVMVDVRPTNEKLRARAVRMVQTLGDVSAELARETLDASAWDVKAALVMLAKECTVAEAHALLDAAGGHVRVVLERS